MAQARLLAPLTIDLSPFGDNQPDAAVSDLDSFVTALQATPLAQLSAARRAQLTDAAKRIQKSLGGG